MNLTRLLFSAALWASLLIAADSVSFGGSIHMKEATGYCGADGLPTNCVMAVCDHRLIFSSTWAMTDSLSTTSPMLRVR
jgi:hypothetical protein